MVSPVIVPAKKLLQDLCQQKIGWDEVIPLEDLARWNTWLSNLPKLSKVSIPRRLKPESVGQIKSCGLHHLADASQVAYGTVTYGRFQDEDDQVHCSFLAAKSRPAHDNDNTHDNTQVGTVCRCP